MRVGLLLLAGLAASAMCSLSVAAASATIVTASWSSSACTGDATVVTGSSTITTGVCTASNNYDDINRSWYTYHCSNSGDQIYQVYYTDSSCSTSSALRVEQQATACTAANYYYRQICQSASNGPAYPLGDFPPSSKWAVTTQYQDKITGATDTCAVAGNVAISSATAIKLNNCRTMAAYNGESAAQSSGTYCSSDLGLYGEVSFTSTSCKSGTAYSTYLSSTTCSGGSQTVCPSGSELPKLPTAGSITYGFANCTTNPRTPTTYSLKAADTCMDHKQVSCINVDGTMKQVTTTYNDFAKVGSCDSYLSNNSYTGAPATETCNYGTKYSCSIEQLGSAASASASMLAVAFAAIVSLLASRQ